MRNIIRMLTLFVLVCAPIAAEATERPVLRVGAYHNPPKMVITNNGTVHGFHRDLLDALLNDRYQLSYITGTWDECLDRLARGEIDIMPDVAYSSERAARFDFTVEPALINWGIVYTARGIAISTIADLDGRRVAVMRNSIHTEGEHGIISQAAAYGVRCTFVTVNTYDEAFNAVRAGNADAAVVNRLFGLLNERRDIIRTPVVFNPSQIRYALQKDNPANAALSALIDTRLRALKNDPDSAYHVAFNRHLRPQISKERLIPGWARTVSIFSLLLAFVAGALIFSSRTSGAQRRFMRHSATLQEIRSDQINASLLSVTLFSIPLFLSILYHSTHLGWSSVAWAYLTPIALTGTGYLLRNRLATAIKLTTVIISLFLTGILIYQTWGRVGTGFTFFLTAGILVSLLYGKRTGAVVLLAGLLIAGGFAALIHQNIITFNYAMIEYAAHPSSWIFAVTAVTMMFFTIMTGVERFHLALVDAVDNLEARVGERTSELNASNALLQQEITVRQQTEERLIAARAEAEQANRAKGIFLANMTHEIRTPLNAILGYSQLLLRERSLGDEPRREIETISASGEHLLEIINEILEMSRIDAGKTEIESEPFDLPELLQGLQRMFILKTTRRNIAFSMAIAPEVPGCIVTDKSRLRQILINLIGNAVKFTDTGSITVTVSTDHGFLRFTVTDTGKGISRDDIEKIFTPFEQTREGRSKGGTGLGLPISREFARLMGGDITAQSSLGAGSSFTLTLPLAGGSMPATCPEAVVHSIRGIATGVPPRILIVDDRAVNRDILVRILTPLGFPVAEAACGEDALALIGSFKPQLLLLDIIMPGMSGQDVILALKADAATAGIRIIVITASALESDRESIMHLGADAFIRKPFKHNEVLRLIGELFDIGYAYETVSHSAPQTQALSPEELRPRISALPEQERRAIYTAAQRGDIGAISAGIARIEPMDATLAAHLRLLEDEFEFESLLNLLRTDIPEKGGVADAY